MQITQKKIRNVVNAIVLRTNPVRIFLFGSTARNSGDNKSVRPFGLPVDVLLTDENEFENRSKIPGNVMYWAKKEGLTLYDRNRKKEIATLLQKADDDVVVLDKLIDDFAVSDDSWSR